MALAEHSKEMGQIVPVIAPRVLRRVALDGEIVQEPLNRSFGSRD
jgi:hypothetical protein